MRACLFVSAEKTCRCGMLAWRSAKMGASVPLQKVPTVIGSRAAASPAMVCLCFRVSFREREISGRHPPGRAGPARTDFFISPGPARPA